MASNLLAMASNLLAMPEKEERQTKNFFLVVANGEVQDKMTSKVALLRSSNS